MKKIFTLLLTLMQFPGFSQYLPEENVVGTTWYDLQTNRSNQNRICVFDNGTIGAVWNMKNTPPYTSNVGTGYNFFNGDEWGTEPVQPVLDGKNPSYSSFGTEGEIVVTEGPDGLLIYTREEAGTGTWTTHSLNLAGTTDPLYSPLVFTSKPGNNTIHILCMRKMEYTVYPVPNDGLILYSRSQDGGATWSPELAAFTELGPDYYYGFSEMALAVALPHGDTLAFLAGDYLTDMVLMKSVNGGLAWNKTVVWDHPYDFFNFVNTYNSDNFYCQDGSCALALDDDGMVHIAFGVSEIRADFGSMFHIKEHGIMAYWNESFPCFPAALNSLHPDTLASAGCLITDFDILNPFQIDIYNSIGNATMPSIAAEGNTIEVVFSQTFGDERHIYQAHSYGLYWEIKDLISDLIHIFDECVYPVLFPELIENSWFMIYQFDLGMGLAVNGNHDFQENKISVMKVPVYCDEYYLDAGFMPSATVISAGDSIQFFNETEGCPEAFSYEWTFEGGNPGSSVEPLPVIHYEFPGIYDVSLMAFNGFEYSFSIWGNCIQVLTSSAIQAGKKEEGYSFRCDQVTGDIVIKLMQPIISSFSVTLYDLTGTELFILKENGNKEIRVPVRSLVQGVYIIKIGISGREYFRKYFN